MGIFIKLEIVPDKISKKSWDLAYKEAIRLIQAYPFLDIISDEDSYNCEWNYADIPVERQIPYCDDQVGFTMRGDLVTMEAAESFELIKDLGYYNIKRSNNSSKDVLEIYKEDSQGIATVFNSKTQGYDYHKYILAIACLFESRLNPYAIVLGDISRGQMEDTIAWANSILEQPIQISDRANNQLLLDRLKKITDNELACLRMFMEATLNEKDYDLGSFIKMNFHKQTSIKYYNERMEHTKIGTFGFSNVMCEYLDLGNDLEDLCSICIAKASNTDDIKYFIKKILSLNLHVEFGNQGKCNQKYLDEQLTLQADKPASKTSDTVDSLFAKFFLNMEFGSQRQPNIYIPIEKIRQVFKEKFSDFNNMDGLIDDFLAEMRSKEKATDQDLTKLPLFENQIHFPTNIEKYDIETLNDLVLWQPDFTICPQLEEFILQFKSVIEKDLNEFIEPFKVITEKAHRMKYLIMCNQYFLLSKKSWDYIAQKLEDLNVFAKMAKIMSIKASEVNMNRLCLGLLNNSMLFEKYMKS